jgi:hypothetical protein
LWARPPAPAEALRAAEILLRAGGFALVTLDLTRCGAQNGSTNAQPLAVESEFRPEGAQQHGSAQIGARSLAPASSLRLRRAGPNLRATTLWLRLVRAAAASHTALVVLTSNARLVGTCADLALELHPLRPHFRGTPTLLDGAEVEAALVRHRGGPEGAVRLRLHPAPP